MSEYPTGPITWAPEDEKNTRLMPNDQGLIRKFQEDTYSHWGRSVIWITDEIIEALKRDGVVLVQAQGEYSTVVIYRRKEEAQK